MEEGKDLDLGDIKKKRKQRTKHPSPTSHDKIPIA